MYREEGDGNHHGKKENHESKKKGGTGRGKIGEKKTMEVVKAFWKDPTEDHQEKRRERERERERREEREFLAVSVSVE